MKEVLKIIGVLTVVCLICAFLLTFVYSGAEKQIEINAKKRIEEAIRRLSPSAETIKAIDTEVETAYELYDADNKFLGYAFLAEGQGYQGKITILAVADVYFASLEGIEIIESVETPGLGSKIKESPFRKQFKKLHILSPIECLKTEPEENNQIKAVTGATVSSRAVVNILNKKIEELRKALKK
jgi:electron transport complex protein RnfG